MVQDLLVHFGAVKMDIPDRIVDQVRLWRFKAVVLVLTPGQEFRFNAPLFVFRPGENKPLGCGVLYLAGNLLQVDAMLDYSLPERLEVETGRKHWIFPHVMHDLRDTKPPTITHLLISPAETSDPQHYPIGTALL